MSNIAHLAAQSAREIQQAQAVVTHNLANSGTTGFKADLYQAQSSYLNAAADGTGTSGSNGSALDYSAGAMPRRGAILMLPLLATAGFR